VGYKEYPMEAHEVHTKDGYILTLVRIIGANKSSKSVDESLTILNSTTSKDEKRKPPVLFVHGFICSAEHWLVNDGNEPGLALRKA
jgi:pimeloyl-ACP methyl ester carboxylesterase